MDSEADFLKAIDGNVVGDTISMTVMRYIEDTKGISVVNGVKGIYIYTMQCNQIFSLDFDITIFTIESIPSTKFASFIYHIQSPRGMQWRQR